MPNIQIDPTEPLTFVVTFHSPHVVAYRFWYKRPGDAKHTIFATGTDAEPSNPSSHTHVVQGLPAGSEIAYLVWLSGNESTAYRMVIDLSQGRQPVNGGNFVLRGATDANGFAQEKGTISVV